VSALTHRGTHRSRRLRHQLHRCSSDRELLDFQSATIDGAGRANAVWTRSIDGVSDTEIRFARQ